MIDTEKFIEGDENELEALMSELSLPLVNYCNSILNNAADAEDAVQTAFIRAYRQRKTLRKADTLYAFIYRIAYHASVDIIRRRKFFKPPKSEIAVNSGYMSDSMKDALLTLKPLDRAVLYGKVVEEYSYGELAQIYGMSETALRKRCERAKRKLAEKINYKGSMIYER